jgi:hypothetical protein
MEHEDIQMYKDFLARILRNQEPPNGYSKPYINILAILVLHIHSIGKLKVKEKVK